VAGLAGLVTGVLVGGIGGRIFMRIAGAIAPGSSQGRNTEAGFRVGEVTFGGSTGLIIFIGLFSGFVAAAYWVALFPWLTVAGRFHGVAFGIVGFAAASATSDLMNTDNIDFTILKNEPVVVVMIFLLFITFGVVLDLTYRLIDKRTPVPDPNLNAVFYTLSALGLFMGSFAAITILTSEACSCTPPMGVGWSLLLVAAATIAWWVSVLTARSPAWLGRASAVAGYLGLAGVLVFGLIRAISDAVEIIN
jgi:hypothetical protein